MTAFSVRRPARVALSGSVGASGNVVAGAAPPPEPFELLADGIWTWCDTIINAIEHGNFLYVAVITSNGSHVASRMNLTTRAVESFTMRALFEIDDHNAGSIVVLSDGRVAFVYSSHNDSTFKYRIYNGTGTFTSSASWTAEAERGVGDGPHSYTYWFRLSQTGNEVFLLFRRWVDAGGGSRRLAMRRTTTLTGSSDPWTPYQDIYGNPGFIPYWQLYHDGEKRLHVVCTDRHPVQGQSSLYAFYGELNGSNVWQWYRSDGTQITDSLPFGPSALTLVYDGSSTRCWAYDLTLDSNGRPRALYCRYPGNSGAQIEYWHARWTGSAWVSHKITDDGAGLYAPEVYYAGGVSFDANDPNVVYLSAPISGVRQIQRWTTSDEGATWTQAQVYTEGGTAGNPLKFRPYSPRNWANGPRVLWLDGRYTTFTDYDTRVMATY